MIMYGKATIPFRGKRGRISGMRVLSGIGCSSKVVNRDVLRAVPAEDASAV
jgi:hypothetical protein